MLRSLQKDEKKLDILEVSAKAIATSPEHAQELANQFYAAVKAADMGESANLTKTQVVMDFFKPATIPSQPAAEILLPAGTDGVAER